MGLIENSMAECFQRPERTEGYDFDMFFKRVCRFYIHDTCEHMAFYG